MPPESLSSFEQMLTSFAYSPVGTATSAVAGNDSIAGGSSKKQIRTKVDATPKGKKRSPAPPQTPPRPWRRRATPSSLPHPDGAAPGGGTTAAAESAVMTSRETVAADSTLAATSATVEDENRELVVSLAGPGTPLVLPPDKNRGGSSSSHFRRWTNVDGSPATFSRFFLRHHPSAHTGGEEKAGEGRGECEHIEHMEEAGEEGKDYSSPDGENKGNRIEATNKRKKRRKRFREGASRPLDDNTVGNQLGGQLVRRGGGTGQESMLPPFEHSGTVAKEVLQMDSFPCNFKTNQRPLPNMFCTLSFLRRYLVMGKILVFLALFSALISQAPCLCQEFCPQALVSYLSIYHQISIDPNVDLTRCEGESRRHGK